MRSPARQSVLVCVCLLLGACGPRNFSNTNDDLRAERMALKQQVAELETDLQRRLGEIQTLRTQLNEGVAPDPEADPPVFVELTFDRYTGPIDTDGDGRDDLLRIYIQTLDQHGRMLPIAARAHIQAVVLKENESPEVYVERTYSPREFDQAYRYEFTGTHYTLEITLDENAPDELTVKVTVTEATTGSAHSQQKAFNINK